MLIDTNSILMAIAGGVMIGLSASATLYFVGRIAGISGIVGGLLATWNDESAWRISFLLGLFAGGVALMMVMPEAIVPPAGRSLAVVAVAGALVGYGTRLGSGCTSGHGVCGLTRLSPRSLVATVTFMATGFVTATLMEVLA